MGAKKKKDNFMLIASVAVVGVIVLSLVIFLIMRGFSAGGSDSSSDSDSSSSSETLDDEDETSGEDEDETSDEDEEEGPLKPTIAGQDDEDDEEETEDTESEETTTAPPQTTAKPQTTKPVTTAPPQTTARPQTTALQTTAKPQTTAAPATTAKKIQLDTPECDVYGTSSGNIKVTWDTVANANGYRVLILNASSEKVVEQKDLSKNSKVYTSELEASEGKEYKVKVQAIGTGNYSDSNLRVVTYKAEAETEEVDKLSTPRNLTLDMDRDGIITAEWDEVSHADEYSVELYKPNGKRVESDTTSDTIYTFSEYAEEEGSYKVLVKAIAGRNSDYTDSDAASKSIKAGTTTGDVTGTKLAAPSNVKMTKRSDYLHVTWSENKKASSYEVELYDPSGSYIDGTEVYNAEHDFYETFTKRGNYKIKIRAISSDYDYDDSPWTTITYKNDSVVLDIPEIVSVECNSSGRLEITISKVEDAETYEIRITGDTTESATTRATGSGVSASRGTFVWKTSKTRYDEGGRYTIRVRACNDSNSYKNSDWDEYDY